MGRRGNKGRRKNKRSKTLNSSLHMDPSSSSFSQINHHINEIKDENNRNWNSLPEPILTSIFTLLPSIADLASAASVSHQWNSAAASLCSSNNNWAPQRPPLILTPLLKSPLTGFKRFTTRWAPPPRCHLIPLDPGLASKPYYQPVLSSQTLAKSLCVGRHGSTLILITNTYIVLHDVFSGEQIRSPEIAHLRNLQIDFGTLTAPLHSSSLSLVLLVTYQLLSQDYVIISWEPNGNGNRIGKFAVKVEIVSFALFNNQIYYLDVFRRVGVVEFDPEVSWRLLDEKVMENLQTLHRHYPLKEHLFVCDGELLMVLFIEKQVFKTNIEVYKLDLDEQKWVKKEKLTNQCLFVDAVGKMGFSCKDPERWGGRSNCIYVARPGYAEYGIYLLNNEEIDILDDENRLFLLNAQLPKWPSPLWVYPNIKSLQKVGSGNAQLKFKKLKRGEN